ncbi:Formyltransferase [Meredithblackwellia eburnea MCA 4105]
MPLPKASWTTSPCSRVHPPGLGGGLRSLRNGNWRQERRNSASRHMSFLRVDFANGSHILVASSFSLLIPSRIIEQFPPLQALNVHPSLLPQFRGAAPIQYSLMNGSVQTGVTVQELGKGKFDQGRILGQQTVDVPPLSTFTSLEPILARHGGDLLVDVLRNLPGRQAEAKPQDDSLASLAPMIVKENARIQWDEDIAQGLIQLQNGIGHQFPLWSTLPPPPSAGSSRDPPSTPPPDIKIQLHIDARIPPIWSFPGERPGTVSYDRETKQVHVSTFGGEKLVLEKVKVANGKWIPAKEWDRVRKSGGLVLGVSTHHELADSGED